MCLHDHVHVYLSGLACSDSFSHHALTRVSSKLVLWNDHLAWQGVLGVGDRVFHDADTANNLTTGKVKYWSLVQDKQWANQPVQPFALCQWNSWDLQPHTWCGQPTCIYIYNIYAHECTYMQRESLVQLCREKNKSTILLTLKNKPPPLFDLQLLLLP